MTHRSCCATGPPWVTPDLQEGISLLPQSCQEDSARARQLVDAKKEDGSRHCTWAAFNNHGEVVQVLIKRCGQSPLGCGLGVRAPRSLG